MNRQSRDRAGPDAPTLALLAGLAAASVYLWRRARRSEAETDRLTAERLGARP